jgi:hypothetical protein
MLFYADCNVTVKPLFGQWYSFLTVLNTEMKKKYIYNHLHSMNNWRQYCNKVSLKRFLRKLTLFRYVTGRYVRSSVVEISLLMKSS